MRIELKHRQNCPSSRQLKHFLEQVIAEERLPLAVEMTESDGLDAPRVFIGTDEINSNKAGHFDRQHLEGRQFLDRLRGVLLEKWNDHAVSPLSHLQDKQF